MQGLRKFAAGLSCALVAAAVAAPALAIPTITFTGGSQTTSFADRTFGFNFFTGRDGFTITSLGYWDADGDGLTQAHEVGVWSADGSTLLASATVPGGTGGFLDSGFRFVSIAPVFLAAGQEYLAGGFTGTNADPIIRYTTATATGITLGSTRFDLTFNGVLSPPLGTQGAGFDDGYFGPNFNGQAAIPEPGTWALMIGGFGLAGAALRRRRAFAVAAR